MIQHSQGPMTLTADQAEALGLPTETCQVRPLAVGHRTLMLERIDPDAPPIPWDRDLVLVADVRAFSVADVLQMVHSSGKSGFLQFEHGDCVKSVFLHAGEVVFASSNQAIDRLGESLVRMGALSLQEQQLASEAYAPPQQFGRFLVERGLLSPRELWDGVKAQVEDIVRSLFAYATGQLFLWEGEVRPDNVVRLALPTGRLIQEGLQHRDELLVFLAQLEDSQASLQPIPGAVRTLEGTAAALMHALAETDSFPAMCQRVGIDSLSGARTVQLLEKLGALRIARDESVTTSNDADAELRTSVTAHAKLLAELTAPLVAWDGADAVRERIADVSREAATRHPHLLQGLAFGPGGVLDPEVLIERAEVFPGNRLREVRAALGELLSYAEFELLNHPKIEDAEGFLEHLDGLRADL
ncbi:MAG: DUF4388 domain-containing protein [Myxococcota bacterium]